MNGRVYDPMLARFVSADPFIQLPYDSQSYNRYSYVMNDPLDATDPSGYFLKWLERKVRREWKRSATFRSIATIAAALLAQQWLTGQILGGSAGELAVHATSVLDGELVLTTAGKMVVGAASGAVGGFVGSNGDLESALRAGITGGAFGYVGGTFAAPSVANYVGHAVVGCASSVIEGGRCGPGAASALVGKLATNHIRGSDLTRGIAATIAGGIGAEIAGGSFKNGAVTAAFGYLFNNLMHAMSAENRSTKPVQYGGLGEIREHLNWLSIAQDGVGFLDNAQMADTALMFRRLQAGMSSDYDTAFYHHELAEALLMRAYRALPLNTQGQREYVMEMQKRAHQQVIQTQKNNEYHLYHPVVVHGKGTSHLFHRYWKQTVPPSQP